MKTICRFLLCGILLPISSMLLPAEDGVSVLSTQSGNLAKGDFKPKQAFQARKITNLPEEKAIRLEGGPTAAQIELAIDPAMKSLTYGCEIRVTDIQKGSGQWDVPSIGLFFLDAVGGKLESKVAMQKGNTDWRPVSKTVDVPAGAAKAQLTLQNRGSGGFADFKNIFVVSGGGAAAAAE